MLHEAERRWADETKFRSGGSDLWDWEKDTFWRGANQWLIVDSEAFESLLIVAPVKVDTGSPSVPQSMFQSFIDDINIQLSFFLCARSILVSFDVCCLFSSAIQATRHQTVEVFESHLIA